VLSELKSLGPYGELSVEEGLNSWTSQSSHQFWNTSQALRTIAVYELCLCFIYAAFIPTSLFSLK